MGLLSRLLVVSWLLSARALLLSGAISYLTPLPHHHEVVWAGAGWTGIRYSRPRECGRNAGPGIGGKGGGSWTEGTLLGFSSTRPQKKSRQDYQLAIIQLVKRYFLSWALGGICFEGLGLRLGLRPSSPAQRVQMGN